MTESAAAPTSATPDVQSSVPDTRIGLSRVGVTGVEKAIRIRVNGTEHLYLAELECYVDLDPNQAGVHMSRFEEVIGEAIDSVVLEEAPFQAEILAAHIAEQVRESQKGQRAELSVTAHYPETVSAPVSGKPTQEMYSLLATAVASPEGTRTLAGVQAQGMTACPCAQEMVTEASRRRLEELDFSSDEIDRVLEAVPVATHNQRGIGTLQIGLPETGGPMIDARDLLQIVEQSMSSEIFELMKRPDELSVVEKAHAQPRFVEDCVREMLRRLAEAYPGLPAEAFVLARQENLETIHRHNVIAERYGTFERLRHELEGGTVSGRHLTRREWLDAVA